MMTKATTSINGGGTTSVNSKSTLSRNKKKKQGVTVVKQNRGAWSAEEDKRLTDYVMIHGDKKWRALPTEAGLNRCGKSCRLRWLNYLRPGIKRGNISEDEEDLIIRLHNLLGNRWSLIAGRLPGRTDNEIKNHWNTHLSKKSLTIEELNLKLNHQKLDPEINSQPTSTFLNTNLSSNMNWDNSTETGMLSSFFDEDLDMNGLFNFSEEHDFGEANQLGCSSELGNENYDKFSDPELNIQGNSSGSNEQFPCSILEFEKLLYSEDDDMFLSFSEDYRAGVMD